MSFATKLSSRHVLARRTLTTTLAATLLVVGADASQAQAAPTGALAGRVGTVVVAARAAQAVAHARTMVGKPYRRGGTGPRAYDCSGSTLTAWRAAGVNLPRTSRDQYLRLTPGSVRIPLSQRRAGDLAFFSRSRGNPSRIYHVAIFLDRDHILQAGSRGLRVQAFNAVTRDAMPSVVRP